uniref:Uncharacterized protein n=1 Tax=Anguilla anguilla TaxID=7936 RepID=A0A0E9V9X1_ANGAN
MKDVSMRRGNPGNMFDWLCQSFTNQSHNCVPCEHPNTFPLFCLFSLRAVTKFTLRCTE